MLGSYSHATVRTAKAADAEALADVFTQSWRHAYRGIIPHGHLEILIRRHNAAWWQAAIQKGETPLVLEAIGQIAGYATYGPARMRGPIRGEIYELYLAPVYQGLGWGELLFEACRHHLDRRRLAGLLVWALVENTTARDFYKRRGGRPALRAYETMGGAKLEKTGFTWD